MLWPNDNVITAEKMVSENKMIQDLIEEAKLEGVHVTACKGCADQLGVTQILEGLDLEVVYQGPRLTKLLKDDENLITI